jgi:hypothetical protein
LVAWDKVCQPIKFGGLGVLNLKRQKAIVTEEAAGMLDWA